MRGAFLLPSSVHVGVTGFMSQSVAIDPESFEITREVPVEGGGPGHSFVLTPDNKRGFVNSAGSDFLAVVDSKAGEVVERVEMGAYP